MKRTYRNPAAFRAALEARLRDPGEGGMALARKRQLLIFERFLARVFAVLGEAVTLKGGLVLEFRLQRARTTKDVDLRWMGPAESMFDELQDAGRLDLGDHLRSWSSATRSDPRSTARGPYTGGSASW